MEKIIVNKEVAELLQKTKDACVHILEAKNYARAVYYFLGSAEVSRVGTLTQQWLDRNNVTVADIENAFKHGWEEIYEFKVGDIVKFPYGHCDSGYYPAIKKIVDNNVFFEDGTYILKSFVTLVCTAGSREDLKK